MSTVENRDKQDGKIIGMTSKKARTVPLSLDFEESKAQLVKVKPEPKWPQSSWEKSPQN